MDMGVNTMIQAMRHMITVMPPKHKGKHLYFFIKFSKKNIPFLLNFYVNVLFWFSTLNSTKSHSTLNSRLKVIMVVRVNIQNYSDEVKMQTTRLLKMLQLKCSCWSFLLFLLLSLFKKKKKRDYIISYPVSF